jgi:hypothetical protein
MNRQERRALERKARKQARKEMKGQGSAITEPSEVRLAPSPVPEPALPPSAARILANRLNAQKSTGPKTPEGKAASSHNNFRHGLRGAFKVLPNEDESEFRNLLRSLREEHDPATPTEELLVQQMAEHFWLTRRAKGFQDTMILNPETFTVRMMNMWMRYETQHQRAFHKCLADLLKLKEEKRKAELHDKKVCVINEKLVNGFEWNRKRAELHELKKRIATAKAEALEHKNQAKKAPETPVQPLTKEQAA